MHEIIFNSRLIPNLEAEDAIPIEVIGGRKFQVATHPDLDKKVLLDVANIRKFLITTIYADATNCYDKVAYAYAHSTLE